MNKKAIITDLRPPESASALVRKLGAMTLLSENEIEFLENIQNNTITVPARKDFIEDGGDFGATFIVRSGWVIRYVLLDSGRRQILSYALPGDILGLHVNFKRKSSYSAAALSNSELAVVDPLRIIEISQNFPIIASGMSWCTAREFAILGDHAVRLGRLSARQRLSHLFLELWHRLRLIGDNEGNWLKIPMTQADIADTLGLSAVHTNRQLQQLRRDGLITIDKQWLKLNDIERLVKLAEFNREHLSEFRI